MQNVGYAASQVENFFANIGDSIANWFQNTF